MMGEGGSDDRRYLRDRNRQEGYPTLIWQSGAWESTRSLPIFRSALLSGCGIALRTASATSNIQIHPGFNPHFAKHVDQVFRGYIPGRIRGVRASPKTSYQSFPCFKNAIASLGSCGIIADR
jgi:hypothetical protein